MRRSFLMGPVIFLVIGLFLFLPQTSAQSIFKTGDVLPDFHLKDQRGRSFKLSDFRGSVVLLNFWATWCPPCVEELPSMDGLNHSLKAKKFNLVAVSVDDSWKPIDEFFSQINRRPSFLILLDANKSLSASYGVVKFPESFLISPTGTLLKHYLGAVEWLHPDVLGEIEAAIHSSVLRLEKKSTKAQ